jgi:hypothetical protein
MVAIIFDLPEMNITISATYAEVPDYVENVITGDATAEGILPIGEVASLFQFKVGSYDYNGTPTNTYRVNYTAPLSSINLTNTIVVSGQISTNDTSITVPEDFIRYLVYKLLGLFYNDALITNSDTIKTNLQSSYTTAVDNKLTELNSYGEINITQTDTANPSERIIEAISLNESTRLNGLSDSVNWMNCPLQINDVLIFKLTITAAEGQENETSVEAILPRSYVIKLTLY